MLILSRKINETIVIADNIEITVTRIDGDTVKLGIAAPRSIPVIRKELFEEMQRTNKEALAKPAAATATGVGVPAKPKLSGLAAKLASKKQKKQTASS